MADGNGKGRIHLLDHQPPRKPATDAQGRPLHRAATVETVYEIVAAETAKVHEYYLNQIPAFAARMIQDALLSYGLIQLSPDAQLAATPPDTPSTAPADPLAEPPPTVPSPVTEADCIKAINQFVNTNGSVAAELRCASGVYHRLTAKMDEESVRFGTSNVLRFRDVTVVEDKSMVPETIAVVALRVSCDVPSPAEGAES